MEFIDLKAQQSQPTSTGESLRANIEQRIRSVLDHGKYILGPEVNEIEEKLAKFIGVNHCIGVSSGTDALLIALMALGIKPGDEVITTPFSFFSTVETILLLGAKPVFVDIEKNTYNLDPNHLEKAISKKTKAIMPVSLYGQPANYKLINEIAIKKNILVIEDGAQSFGSTHHKLKSGNLTDIGTTSFFPSKPLGGYGDGGACFTNNPDLAKTMREISLHGQNQRYSHKRLGINGRMDTIQAAILLAKLDLFDKEVKARNEIGSRYTKKLNSKGFKETPFISEENTSVYAQYTIQVDNRNKVIDELKALGIPTSIHYPSLISEQKALIKTNVNTSLGLFRNIFNKKFRKTSLLQNAKKASERVLSLPMHPMLKDEDQDFIVDSLIRILN